MLRTVTYNRREILSRNVLSQNTITSLCRFNAYFVETRWGISYIKLQKLFFGGGGDFENDLYLEQNSLK